MARRTPSGKDRLSRTLGVFSLGLGTAQLLSPARMCELIGVRPTSGSRGVMAAVGVQELTVGTGILARRRPVGLLWTRVAGDVLHLAILGAALGSDDSDQRRIARAILAVAGVTVLDVIASVRRGRAGANGHTLRARTSLTVNRPSEEVYRRWRDLERLPEFMAHLESVRTTGDGRSHWVARAPAGRTVEWDAEIVDDRPNELIAWRSVERADVDNSGSVRLTPVRDGRATEVTVELEYDPPAGRVGAAVARLLGEEPQQQLRDDLRRFKQVVETGEVVRSEGSPEGMSTRRLARQHPARPLS